MEKLYKTDSIESVKLLCKVCGNQISDVDVRPVNSHCIVDGKSILGLFSINLSAGFYVKLNTDDCAEAHEFFSQLDKLFES